MSKENIQINAESGQTMAEYTVVLGMITLAIVTTFTLLSGAIDEAFMRTVEIVESAL